jgi:hypothetical protein
MEKPAELKLKIKPCIGLQKSEALLEKIWQQFIGDQQNAAVVAAVRAVLQSYAGSQIDEVKQLLLPAEEWIQTGTNEPIDLTEAYFRAIRQKINLAKANSRERLGPKGINLQGHYFGLLLFLVKKLTLILLKKMPSVNFQLLVADHPNDHTKVKRMDLLAANYNKALGIQRKINTAWAENIQRGVMVAIRAVLDCYPKYRFLGKARHKEKIIAIIQSIEAIETNSPPQQWGNQIKEMLNKKHQTMIFRVPTDDPQTYEENINPLGHYYLIVVMLLSKLQKLESENLYFSVLRQLEPDNFFNELKKVLSDSSYSNPNFNPFKEDAQTLNKGAIAAEILRLARLEQELIVYPKESVQLMRVAREFGFLNALNNFLSLNNNRQPQQAWAAASVESEEEYSGEQETPSSSGC